MLKVSLLIQATERVTGPVRRIRSAIRGMVVTGERDVKKLDRVMERLGKTANRVGRGIGSGMRIGALAIAGAAGFMIGKIIKTSMEFERYQAVLENSLGSPAAAKNAMAWVSKFAEKTPYELSEVMEAFVRLRAYGIDPMTGALESAGNAAAGMGVPIMQAVEALADAQTGEFERLKEFGITAAVSGDKVALSFVRAGKKITQTVKKDAVAINQAIRGIWDGQFGGMMDRLSRTLGGMLSNLQDVFARLALAVGNAGFFEYLKKQLSSVMAWIERLQKSGQLDAWAKRVSDKLVLLGEKLRAIDWDAVWSFLKGIGRALLAIGSAFVWVEKTFGIFNVVVVAIVGKIAIAMYGLAAALGVVSIAGAPLWAVVGVIALLAAGALLVWKNWDQVSGFFARMWAGIKTAFQLGIAAIWAIMPAWMKGILKGATFVLKLFGGGAPPPGVAPAAGAPQGGRRLKPGESFRTSPGLLRRTSADVGGRIDLRIRTDKGTVASVTRAESHNKRVPIDISRGPLAFG